jgi:AcrR family transcriptional regulator
MKKTAPLQKSPASAEARQEILKAAAEVFMEYGFSATSIDAVAHRMGATKGRIYHYYRSKADLYFDIQIAAVEKLIAEIEPIARGEGNAAQRLRAMAFRHTSILMEDLPMQKVAVSGLERELLGGAPGRDAKTLHTIVQMRDSYEQIFAEVIDQGIRDGLFLDLPPRLATKPFFGTLNWLTIWYVPRRLQKPEDITEIAGVLTDAAMRGILKSCEGHPNATTP